MADKLPIVNYSGKQKEIASGDKIPISYLQGADSIIEIPDTAFVDADNPELSEVQTWVTANLTTDELVNSTVVYVRDIVLKPKEYTFPSSSRTLTISGSDQATLDSITIDGTPYSTGLPLYLQDVVGLPLNDADLYTLQNAIVSIFATAGFTVECQILYNSTLTGCIIKIWQIVYNSGSPSCSIVYNYTNNATPTSTSSITNTASVASGDVVDFSSQENPFAIYKVIAGIVYQINIKERTSFYEISVRNLPTHDLTQHAYGLIAVNEKTGLKYLSTKEGWILIPNSRYGSSFGEPIVEISNSIVYTDDPVYVKITPKTNSLVLPSTYCQAYVRVTKLEPFLYMSVVDSSTEPFVEINGKLEVTNSSWIQSTTETTRTTFRNITGVGSYGVPLYLKVQNTDAYTTSGANVNVDLMIHNGIYQQVGSSISLSSFNVVLDGTLLRLDETPYTKKNIQLPSYTDTDLGTITLGTEDTGKQIWNITQSEVQVWDGAAWVALGTGGGGGANLTFTGASSPYTLASDSGTDVTFSAGANITLTRTGNDLEIAATGGGATNLTFSGSGPFTLESDTGTDVTITEGTNIDIVRTGNDLTFNAIGTDLSVSGGSSVITLASSTGADVTLTAGTNITLTQSGSDVEIASTSSGGISLGLVNAIRLGIAF